MKTFDLCVVGGAGHVGLPLSIVFAGKGKKVLIYDINEKVLDGIRRGEMPFMEHDAADALKRVLGNGNLTVSCDVKDLASASTIIVTIGTPVDEFLNPVHKAIETCMAPIVPYMKDGTLLVLRSTVYPGTTDWLEKYLRQQKKNVLVAYCPERIIQGYAIKELTTLPQLVSGTTPEALEHAAQLFSLISPKIVKLSPMEAEFAKLFSNAYRYIQFAVTNQFFMMTHKAGVDYHRVVAGMKEDYERVRDFPGPGFAAGPCLFKDTMQLSAFSGNQFSLGNTAMMVNEGLVLYLVDELVNKYGSKLSSLKVGLLGMAFKANSDDARSSLSYKLKKHLKFRASEVLVTDPHVKDDPEIKPLSEVVKLSDVLILCVPHAAYRDFSPAGKPFLDIWGFFGKGFSNL